MNSVAFPLHDFHGGIHPPENKAQSTSLPIEQAPLPGRLVIQVSQPGFREPELLVMKGDQVRKGQVIARGKQSMGVVYHASSSGTVEDISEQAVPNASGIPDLCVTIQTDGRDEWIDHQGCADPGVLQPQELLERIADAGINGLGGAGFPTHIKLNHQDNHIRTLIINACECEPFITADDMLMRERAGEILQGIRLLMQLVAPQRCLIGIEDNKPQAIVAMQDALREEDDDIRVVTVPTRYPSGSEKQLIHLLTGLEIASGSLPAQQGILCQNVGTAWAIARAIHHGEPLISRITTCTGAALSTPRNLEVLIGTPMDTLMTHCGIDREQCSRFIMGGSLMGVNLDRDDVPVLKISNCIIATTEAELPLPGPAQACIRCGMCADACPVSLLPQQLYWFARSREHDKAREHNLFDCIECGACAWVCPSNIPLVQYYRAAKGEIRDEMAKHQRAEMSQKRYEFHQERVAREKARQEQRRRERAVQARKKHPADGGKPADAQATIQGALARVKAKKASQQSGTSDTESRPTPDSPTQDDGP